MPASILKAIPRLLWSLLCATLLYPTTALSAFQTDPAKTTAITVTVDGNTVGVDKTATPKSGDAMNGAILGGNYEPDGGANELTALYAARGGALVYAQAQGAVHKETCGDKERFYQRARITLNDVPGGSKVWVFSDPNVGSGNNVRQYPHFNEPKFGGSPWGARILETEKLYDLCLDELGEDGPSSRFIENPDGTRTDVDVLNLGVNEDYPRPTAGHFRILGASETSASFDVFVPMDGTDSGMTGINLALAFVVDVGNDGINDQTDDVGIEAWISSKPWWTTFNEFNSNDTMMLAVPKCAESLNGTDEPCWLPNATGLFDVNGDSGENHLVSMTLVSTDPGQFEATIEMAPINAVNTGPTGYSIPNGSNVRIGISWPTSGTFYNGLTFGSGDNEIDVMKIFADTPILVDTAKTATDSLLNRWDIQTVGNRVQTVLVGQAKSTSAAISRETWWPKCDVDFNEAGSVESTQCGADVTEAVTATDMVFSSVPATLTLFVNPNADAIAGGLVSTNGQGFAFGPDTFSETDPSYQFTAVGPSVKQDGSARNSDGFFYVCLPEAYLTSIHDTTGADAASKWTASRDNEPVSVIFQAGKCGLQDNGLVASLAEFGYSAPIFALKEGPAAPTITSVLAGDGQVTVSFTTAAGNTSYTVTAFPGNAITTCTNSPCTVSNLTNDTPYTFTVKATNSAGTGPASDPSDSVTPTSPADDAASGLPIWLLYEATKQM